MAMVRVRSPKVSEGTQGPSPAENGGALAELGTGVKGWEGKRMDWCGVCEGGRVARTAIRVSVWQEPTLGRSERCPGSQVQLCRT